MTLDLKFVILNQMPERIRTFGNAFNFLDAAKEGLIEKNGWNIEVWDAGDTLIGHRAASVARLYFESSPTLIWLNPSLPKDEGRFAYTWSLGIIICTDNLALPQEPEKLGISVSLLSVSGINHKDILDNVTGQNNELVTRGVIFALASGLQIPTHLSPLYSQLQEVPPDQVDRYVGLNPRDYFRDNLGLRYRSRISGIPSNT